MRANKKAYFLEGAYIPCNKYSKKTEQTLTFSILQVLPSMNKALNASAERKPITRKLVTFLTV